MSPLENVPEPDPGDIKSASDKPESLDFIRAVVTEDVRNGKNGGRVHTRFPPEPNGFLHIGHAKAFCLDFGIAEEFGGKCNLRMDDTNPLKEETKYVEAIQRDIKWIGFDWEDRLFYASNYFDQLYEWAIQMIKQGDAFVCDLSADQIASYRGGWNEPGKESPYRNRTIEENLDLFERMRDGEFPDGSKTLRAKIGMSSGNMNMRDPVMYRILRATHHNTGDKWCIYPTYDWTHGQSDSIEGVTHSLCDLDFEQHRPLYDWFLDKLGIHHPQQIEFARLNVKYTITSKRKLIQLVDNGIVSDWDDPRMPTISGLRRRGYTPESIKDFMKRIGMAKAENLVDVALLEHCLREDLNKRANRYMAVLNPLKVVITNYPEGKTEDLPAVNNPEDPSAGSRTVPFSREIFIERDDFMENPPKKFYRLAPGREVRLRYAYFITCTDVIKDKNGEITELRCTYDPATHGGNAPDGRKVKATIHWVSAEHAVPAEVRLFESLFTVEDPRDVEEGKNFRDYINPESMTILSSCKLEPSLAGHEAGFRCQFERLGYFCVDPDSSAGKIVFNRTVTLRDEWAKLQKKE